MNRFCASLCLGALLLGAGIEASQVTWGAAQSNGVGVVDAGGTPLPIGDLVLIGHFNLTTAQIIANGGDKQFLLANFVQYASAFIGDGNPNPSGPDDGYWLTNSVNSSNALGVQGKAIDYWLFNAPTVAGATQHGIYTGSASTNALIANAWIFPNDANIIPTTTTDLSDVPHNSSGILWGSFEMDAMPGSGDGVSPLFFLASFNAVPEPSTWFMGLLLACALSVEVFRRRTRA